MSIFNRNPRQKKEDKISHLKCLLRITTDERDKMKEDLENCARYRARLEYRTNYKPLGEEPATYVISTGEWINMRSILHKYHPAPGEHSAAVETQDLRDEVQELRKRIDQMEKNQ